MKQRLVRVRPCFVFYSRIEVALPNDLLREASQVFACHWHLLGALNGSGPKDARGEREYEWLLVGHWTAQPASQLSRDLISAVFVAPRVATHSTCRNRSRASKHIVAQAVIDRAA